MMRCTIEGQQTVSFGVLLRLGCEKHHIIYDAYRKTSLSLVRFLVHLFYDALFHFSFRSFAIKRQDPVFVENQKDHTLKVLYKPFSGTHPPLPMGVDWTSFKENTL